MADNYVVSRDKLTSLANNTRNILGKDETMTFDEIVDGLGSYTPSGNTEYETVTVSFKSVNGYNGSLSTLYEIAYTEVSTDGQLVLSSAKINDIAFNGLTINVLKNSTIWSNLSYFFNTTYILESGDLIYPTDLSQMDGAIVLSDCVFAYDDKAPL